MTDDAVRLAHQFGVSESRGLDELIVETGLPAASVREAISVSSLMGYPTVMTGRFLRIFRLQAACLMAKRNPPADPRQSDSAWRGIDAYKLCSCVNFGCRETTGPGQGAAIALGLADAFQAITGIWRCQAARTELRNRPTSDLRRLLSPDSERAAVRTCDDADPVSLAPRCTSVMLDET